MDDGVGVWVWVWYGYGMVWLMELMELVVKGPYDKDQRREKPHLHFSHSRQGGGPDCMEGW